MNLQRVFKNLVIADFVILLLLIIIGFFEPVDEVVEVIPTIEIVSLFTLVIYFYNLYLLFRFKSLGKSLYVPLICFQMGLGLAIMSVDSYQPPSNIFYPFAEWVGGLISGMIITFIYFTDLKTKFDSDKPANNKLKKII